MFSIFFINRPIIAKVLSIFIILMGLIALNKLPVAQFPQITPPTIQVSATYTGGNANIVEQSVTSPLEEKLNGIDGLAYMSSTSSSDGVSSISLHFELGKNLDNVAIDVQNKVAAVLPSLPSSVKQQGVSVTKSSSSILQLLTITSSNPKHDALFLSNFASLNMIEDLKRVEGVGDVKNMGERKYSMRIWLNPSKLSALNLTINDVSLAIKEQNLQAALGTIGDTSLKQQSKFQYTLVSKTRINSVKEFENIILRQNRDGSKVRLKDVSRVELGAESYKWSGKLNNHNATLLAIYQLPSANALDVAKKIQEKIQELKKKFPKEIKIAPTYDTTKFVDASIQEVIKTLMEALLLVLVVVYLFLQSFRATILPAVAIPISLIGSFAILYAVGFTINTLTLFGLILAIGIVVDDAILVVENVESNLEKNPNLTLKEASTKAMKEIFTPIVSTTLVLLAVFVPVAFIPGISGALYKQFAMTIAFAVLISAIVALTLSPALAASILRRKSKKNIFFEKFDQGLEVLKKWYEKVLKVFIKFWYIILLIYALLLAGAYIIFHTLPTGFVPTEDQGTLIAAVSMQPGTNLQTIEEKTQQVVDLIKNTKGVKDVISINGYNLISGSLDSSASTMFIVLQDWEERKTKETSADGIVASIQVTASQKIKNANVMAFNPPSIPGLSAIGGFDVKLQNLNSMPMNEFAQKAQAFIQDLNKDERIASAYTMFNANYPQLYIDIDRDKVFSLGLKLSDIFTVLQTYLGSFYVNDFNKFGKTYRVFLQADEKYRTDKNNIASFFVKNNKGQAIPLNAVAKIKYKAGLNTITHFNARRSISIGGMHNINGGYSSSDAINAIEEIAKKTLPANIGYSYAGTTLQEKKAGNAAFYIFMLSLIMVFLLLSAQYESWMIPMIIMLPIPVVMFGALGANMIAGLINDTYTQIGMVLLIGMSTKNAILIVEFAQELRKAGKSLIQSAIEASLLRLRAILMTIFSFLLGILPLVFASGVGSASRQSLGTAVFGGMLMSTILTFFLTPILFVILGRLREKFKKEEI